MDIVQTTRAYEKWLRAAIPVVASDLAHKHALMRESAFAFLRATYYRWAELWPALCPELAKAPRLLCVGDLHIENFGTWRDAEGRLVWGVNDFDEAHEVSYANDLVRVAASVFVAVEEGTLSLNPKKACREILAGYAKTMRTGDARAFVLEESNAQLRDLALGENRSPRKFWERLAACRKAEPPEAAKALLASHLPKGTTEISYARRTAGAGSLGAPRFVARGICDGGPVAREAKAREPASHAFVAGSHAAPAAYRAILDQAVRAPDPFLHVADGWIVRRLAPHCERIELADIAVAKERRSVLRAMGRETANVHGLAAAAHIVKDLSRREEDWLYDQAGRMAEAVFKDWKSWRKGT